jgi:hypothetical protein
LFHCLSRLENSGISNLSFLQVFLCLLISADELVIVRAREGQKTARIDTHCFHTEPHLREMSAFNEEELTNCVWNSWEEFHNHSEFVTCSNFTNHRTAFYKARTTYCSQVNVELEWHLANIFDKELLL